MKGKRRAAGGNPRALPLGNSPARANRPMETPTRRVFAVRMSQLRVRLEFCPLQGIETKPRRFHKPSFSLSLGRDPHIPAFPLGIACPSFSPRRRVLERSAVCIAAARRAPRGRLGIVRETRNQRFLARAIRTASAKACGGAPPGRRRCLLFLFANRRRGKLPDSHLRGNDLSPSPDRLRGLFWRTGIFSTV